MEKFSLVNNSTQTRNDKEYRAKIGAYYDSSKGTNLDKLNNFSRFVPRQCMSLFLAKNELFKKIIGVHGNIIECGVYMGGGLFTWAQLSAIYEPINHNRKIIGFDTFSGLTPIKNKDGESENVEYKNEGAYCFDDVAELEEGINLFDMTRPIGHINKVELVQGDATQTIPEYISTNQHSVISLLYLDFDLYEPTLCALKHFLPRMPIGSLIAFDELNQKQWPGETLAVLEKVGLNNLEIQRFSFTPSLSFAVLNKR